MIDGRGAKILDLGKNQTAPLTADLMAEEQPFANQTLNLNQTNIIEHGIRAYKGIMKTGTLGYMKTRQLGNSDLFITPVGYGSWAIGGSGWQFAWGKQNDNDSVAAIHRALELGVNWIDTAAVYGLGHSEEVVTRALSSWPGPRPYLFTKCGLRWDAQGQTHRVLTATSIRQECEDSLRRLNVDAIDLYQSTGRSRT